ncbi:MAG: hypothetical protein CM1200mP10_02560 [Candidatus Neomarinimicrobiota bacterium]|nr:MAG: hypothetical protein CM1200mP10_02560 [Candidatus Neomarinimicrobiota bacterium]
MFPQEHPNDWYLIEMQTRMLFQYFLLKRLFCKYHKNPEVILLCDLRWCQVCHGANKRVVHSFSIVVIVPSSFFTMDPSDQIAHIKYHYSNVNTPELHTLGKILHSSPWYNNSNHIIKSCCLVFSNISHHYIWFGRKGLNGALGGLKNMYHKHPFHENLLRIVVSILKLQKLSLLFLDERSKPIAIEIK